MEGLAERTTKIYYQMKRNNLTLVPISEVVLMMNSHLQEKKPNPALQITRCHHPLLGVMKASLY